MTTTTHHHPKATTERDRERAERMEHIYRTYWRYVASRVREQVRPGDVQEVEELTQEVMVRAWRWLDTQTGPDRLSAWLRTIATHTVTDHYRRRARHPEATVSPDSTLWDTLLPADHSQPGDRPQCEALTAALDTLPPATAVAVQLREGYGLYGREVAAILGCSKPHADRLVRDGLTALRAICVASDGWSRAGGSYGGDASASVAWLSRSSSSCAAEAASKCSLT
jgi:RNA polymerase sigma factor (sigma-70 family)